MPDFYSRGEAIAIRDLIFAERHITNPRVAITFLSFSLESLLKVLAERHGVSCKGQHEFHCLIEKLCKAERGSSSIIPESQWYHETYNIYFHVIRKLRNDTAHEGLESTLATAQNLKDLYIGFVEWYFKNYSNASWRNLWEENKHKYQDQGIEAYDQIITQYIDQRLAEATIRKAFPPDLEEITKAYFEDNVISEPNVIKQLAIDYYLKFNNNNAQIRQIVANNIYIEPADEFITHHNSESKILSVDDILQLSQKGQAVLVKFLAVGGVGKSTLMWHLMRKLADNSNVFLLKRASAESIEFVFKNQLCSTNGPTVFFLDDTCSTEDNRENLVRLGKAISDNSHRQPILLFVFERYYRYDKIKNKKDFERNFLVERTIHYSTRQLRVDVLDKILYYLLGDGASISLAMRRDCLKIFTECDSDSLIDNAFNLFIKLKHDNRTLNYRFDWDDWKEACVGKFEVFEDLFKFVAFFYQFGIRVPYEIVEVYYKDTRNAKDLLRELLGTFHGRFTPIIIGQHGDGKKYFALRHEKMGEWFFKTSEFGPDTAKELFEEFLNNVNSRSYAYLFRNIARKNSEFQISEYSNILPLTRLVEIVDKYLNNIDESNYGDEEYKLLMEKHFALFNLGYFENSLGPLKVIIRLKSDNIFALSRLAYCLEETDPETSVEFYQQLLSYDEINTHACLGLYRVGLSQANNDAMFFEAETRAFGLARSNQQIARILIKTISTSDGTLSASTTKHLLELVSHNQLITTRAIELFINKGKFDLAFNLLSNLNGRFDELSNYAVNKVCSLLIYLYYEEGYKSTRGIELAMELSKKQLDLNESDPLANVMYGRVLSAFNKGSSFREAEFFMNRALDNDSGEVVIFQITKFYRDYAKQNNDRRSFDLPRTISILLRGISLLELRLSETIDSKVPVLIELCLFYNKVIEAIHFHALRIHNGYEKYGKVIDSFANKTERHITFIVNELNPKLKFTDTASVTNYRVDESLLSLYTQICPIATEFVIGVKKRHRTLIKLNIFFDTQLLDFQGFVKSMLSQAHELDNDNPYIIEKIIEFAISLGGDDISKIVQGINFNRYTTKQKAKLARMLISSGWHDLGIKLITRFGQLNSTDPNVKNDLMFCYHRAKLWKCLVNVVKNISLSNNGSLDLVFIILGELPINSVERFEAKEHLAKEYIRYASGLIASIQKGNKNGSVTSMRDNRQIENLNKGLRRARRELCKLYFVAGKMENSLAYYVKYRNQIDIFESRGLPLDRSYTVVSAAWIEVAIEFWHEAKLNSGATEWLIKDYHNHEAAMAIVSDAFGVLCNLDINYAAIEYNSRNELDVYRKTYWIVSNALDILFAIMLNRNEVSEEAVEFGKKLVCNNPNIFFRKMFIYKLLKQKSKHLLYKNKYVITFLQDNCSRDADISRMVGRVYLTLDKFDTARELFAMGLNNATTDRQRCYAYHNLADLIITRIERLRLHELGGKKGVRDKIGEAERVIAKRKQFCEQFQHDHDLFTRIDAIRLRYNL